ncbi:hypothetical protein [Burkholderia sp. Ac-20365]|uniref:hypothetical protein n=1 Tax=Burkholderia sp. Ac-20365 TaxID=2703897 RepID=UPI00197B9DBF|nr:hypothetical protein [Burkholderia sp. Ac-20365]MBN3760753.1 hypothetical protein [Burkholderia sp. Ac-20365]
MQHREEAVELSLHTGTVAAEKPADQCGEIQFAETAEMSRIGNMTRAQFREMKVADEPAQYRDNPSSYRDNEDYGSLQPTRSARVYRRKRLNYEDRVKRHNAQNIIDAHGEALLEIKALYPRNMEIPSLRNSGEG